MTPSGIAGKQFMAARDAVVEKVREITERAGLKENIEVVDVQLLGGGGTRVLRIYIDKPGGVTHGDCEMISQHVGTVLDVEDVIPGSRYTLEVSSPGVERKISKPADFERFQGQKIKVVLSEPAENSKAWTGTLIGFADGIVTMEPSPGRTVSFPFEHISRANLKFDW